MSSEASPKALRVVVVDDNPLIRDSVALAVQRINEKLLPLGTVVQLFEAEEGAAAWDRILESPVDLVVTDLYMPVMSGLALITRIRETPETAAIPILAISASIEEARAVSLAAGADRFLQKPLRLLELMDALPALLRLELPS